MSHKQATWSCFGNKTRTVCQESSNLIKKLFYNKSVIHRGGTKAAATSKMECFVIIVNGFQPLTIITKHSILDIAAALDPPLIQQDKNKVTHIKQ